MTRVLVKGNCVNGGPQLSGRNFVVITDCFLSERQVIVRKTTL